MFARLADSDVHSVLKIPCTRFSPIIIIRSPRLSSFRLSTPRQAACRRPCPRDERCSVKADSDSLYWRSYKVTHLSSHLLRVFLY